MDSIQKGLLYVELGLNSERAFLYASLVHVALKRSRCLLLKGFNAHHCSPLKCEGFQFPSRLQFPLYQMERQEHWMRSLRVTPGVALRRVDKPHSGVEIRR
jgi:hypothetical protein